MKSRLSCARALLSGNSWHSSSRPMKDVSWCYMLQYSMWQLATSPNVSGLWTLLGRHTFRSSEAASKTHGSQSYKPRATRNLPGHLVQPPAQMQDCAVPNTSQTSVWVNHTSHWFGLLNARVSFSLKFWARSIRKPRITTVGPVLHAGEGGISFCFRDN